MNKKGDMTKIIFIVAVIALSLIAVTQIFGKGVGDGFSKISNYAKQVDMNGNSLPYYLEVQMDGRCPCDKETAEKYYYFKEETYTEPQPWDNDPAIGYLLGYNGGELTKSPLVNAPSLGLRLSEDEMLLIEEKFSEEPLNLDVNLNSLNFNSIRFENSATLKDLCIPNLLAIGEECSYDKFILGLIENNDGVPIKGCQTTPEICEKKYKAELEKKDK